MYEMQARKICLSSTDFALLESESKIKLGGNEQIAINDAIQPLVPTPHWDDRQYIKKRREAAKSISSHLTKIEKLIVRTFMVDEFDDSEGYLPDIAKMRDFFDQEVKSFTTIGRPKRFLIRDILKELLSIYRQAGGTHWRVRKIEDKRQSKFIDFVFNIYDCAKVSKPSSYEAFCKRWEDIYRLDTSLQRRNKEPRTREKKICSRATCDAFRRR
jgi:hypothetical protein